MLASYYHYVLLGVEVFAVACNGNVRHLSVGETQGDWL